MIVHDGTSYPYLESIVENLHYYVDELFEFILRENAQGITDIKAILSHARIMESEKLSILSSKATTLTDDEFLRIIA